MAKAHPGLSSLSKYLKEDFHWKKDWVCEELNKVFTRDQVYEALKRVKKTDPELFRLLEWRWMTYRSRSSIANSLYLDPSTLKRKWDKAMNLVVSWLEFSICNEDNLLFPLESIDLISYD